MVDILFENELSEKIPVKLYYLPESYRHSVVVVEVRILPEGGKIAIPAYLVIKSKYFGYTKKLPKRSGQFFLRDPSITLIEGSFEIKDDYGDEFLSSILEVPKEDLIKTIRLVIELGPKFKYLKTIKVI